MKNRFRIVILSRLRKRGKSIEECDQIGWVGELFAVDFANKASLADEVDRSK